MRKIHPIMALEEKEKGGQKTEFKKHETNQQYWLPDGKGLGRKHLRKKPGYNKRAKEKKSIGTEKRTTKKSAYSLPNAENGQKGKRGRNSRLPRPYVILASTYKKGQNEVEKKERAQEGIEIFYGRKSNNKKSPVSTV